jgi:hypothetical protein
MKLKPLLLSPLLLLAGMSHVQGAVDVSISAEIRLGKALPPPPPEVIVIREAGPKGPPPWAPAHGVRRNRAYYYYPGAQVYFRPEDRMWFYLDGRDWRFGASLPATIRVDFDRSVSLSMESEQPHQFHDKVQGYYPADYFVTHVRVKDKDGKPDKVDHDKSDRADAPSPGNSQGKGKGKGKNK